MKEVIKIIGGAGLIYIVIVLIIAVIPAIDLSQTPPGPHEKPLTPLQAEGRQVFASNGCAYCHTQQVRPTEADADLGRPTAPGDYAYRTPPLAGSERTGPDLSNVGKTRGSKVWQYIHLYEPRAVEPKSIMPNFKFLFEVVDTVPDGTTAVPVPQQYAPAHGNVIPTHKAKALVAYLLSLKQTKIPGYKMHGGMGGVKKVKAGNDNSDTRSGGLDGAALFTQNCAACHQTNGEGLPHAFPALKGNTVVLDDNPTEHIHVVLHGLHGKTIDGEKYSGAMPPFDDQLSDAEIAAIINHERTSWGNDAKTITAAEVKTVRAGKTAEASEPASNSQPATVTATKSVVKKADDRYRFDAKKGAALYSQNCAACHQASGQGLPNVFPPLKGNPAVLDDNSKLHISTILHGAHGKTIDGTQYSSVMPPFGDQLNNEEIADIANHERSSWGNSAKAVTPDDVAKLRGAGN